MKKPSHKVLRKAYALLTLGKYGRVINLLEPKVPIFLENEQFYYILGIACLENRDRGGAETYLKRAVQVSRFASEPLLYTAVLALLKGSSTEAVRIWLDILDNDPQCKQAKRGLEIMRKISSQEEMTRYIKRGRFQSILPPRRPPVGLILFPLFGVAAVLGMVYLSLPLLSRLEPTPRERDFFTDISPQDLLSEDEGLYQLSEGELKDSLAQAQNYFDNFEDNLAQVEINRILYSNAAEGVKQKARILEGYLKEPDFTNFQNNFSYQDLSQNPFLYNKVYVRWMGRVSNLQVGEEGMSFDFLVGYHTSEVVEGIVPTVTSFQTRITTALAVEVLGQVQIDEEGRLSLRGVSLRNVVDF